MDGQDDPRSGEDGRVTLQRSTKRLSVYRIAIGTSVSLQLLPSYLCLSFPKCQFSLDSMLSFLSLEVQHAEAASKETITSPRSCILRSCAL
jgi:hypothetical protein